MPTIPDHLANPHRIGLTAAERVAFVPGRAVKTDGVKRWTTAHMNLTRSLADVYEIVIMPNGTKRGVKDGELNHYWLWRERKRKPDART